MDLIQLTHEVVWEIENKYKIMDKKTNKLIHDQISKPDNDGKSYPRVINQTNITFSNEELLLLNKGLKYNLSHKRKQWISNLAFEAETATTLLPAGEQEYIRHQVAHNGNKLCNQQNERPNYNNMQTRNENKIINQIKDKLTKNKAMISKADKCSSIIILYQEEYKERISKFISNNSFTIANGDITKKLQKGIRNTINECQQVRHKSDRWKYVNLNPMAPTIRDLVKIDKEGAPVRPIIKWRNAPAHKLAKMLTKKLHTYIPLPYTFNIKNTVQLMTDLTDLPYDHNIKFA